VKCITIFMAGNEIMKLNIDWGVIFFPLCVQQETSVKSSARHDTMIK
jgi:hypothetical protein